MRAVPAVLEARTETETVYGGRGLSWAPVAAVWLELDRSTPRETEGGDRPLERSETATGRARSHPALAAGVRLITGDGPPWTVRALHPDDPAPGRVVLLLDRLL